MFEAHSFCQLSVTLPGEETGQPRLVIWEAISRTMLLTAQGSSACRERNANLATAHPFQFFYEYPAMDASRLSDLCQKIYFPTEDYTIATFVTVHVSLFLLFRQMQKDTAKELQLGPSEIEICVATCSKNAQTSMGSMRVYMEANFENIEALLLAVSPEFLYVVSSGVLRFDGHALSSIVSW